jgi:hypothetical protein
MGIGLCLVLLSNLCLSRPVSDSLETAQRKCVIEWAEAQTKFVRELTNHNDSKYINQYFLLATGHDFSKASAHNRQWCAVFVTAAFKSCNVPIPVKGNLAAVRTWEAANKYVLERTAELFPGDVVTFTFGSHIGVVKDYNNNPRIYWIDTTEGNTTDPNDRRKYSQKQQGAYNKRRLKKEVKRKIRIIKHKQND